MPGQRGLKRVSVFEPALAQVKIASDHKDRNALVHARVNLVHSLRGHMYRRDRSQVCVPLHGEVC